MSTRGRPKLGPQALTATERKRRWDLLMRNSDGADPTRPTRRPVVIYLSDEAREVLRNERALAREAQVAPCLDSALVEQLLLRHSTASTQARDGLPLDRLLNSFSTMRRALAVARLERDRLINGRGRTSKSLLAELSALEHREVDATQIGTECLRRNNTAPDQFFEKLAGELQALLLHTQRSGDLTSKLRRAIGSHIGRLFPGLQ